MRDSSNSVRWSTRSLFVATAAIAATLAVFLHGGPLAGAGALFVLLLTGAHVVGTMVGYRMRDEGDSFAATDPDRDPDMQAEVVGSESVSPSSPFAEQATTLYATSTTRVAGTALRTSTRRSGIWVLVAMLVSGVVGGGILTSAYPDRLNPYNVCLAIVAAAVMGGMAMFGVVKLCGAVRCGLRHESQTEWHKSV